MNVEGYPTSSPSNVPQRTGKRLKIAFESERLTYSDRPVDLYNSGVNQILSVAASHGHRLFHFSMADLYIHEAIPYARMAVLQLDESYDGDPLWSFEALRKIEERTVPLTTVDLYIIRGDDIRTSHTRNLDILRAIESHITCLESIDATLSTCDKYELVRRAGDVPQPVTFKAESVEDALDCLPDLPQADGTFVVKDRYGYGCGAQVHRLRFDDKRLTSRLNDFLRAYDCILLQEFCPEVACGDIVVPFWDGEIVGGALRRTGGKGQWKTNASLGATESAHELTPEQERIARTVRERFSECRLCSVDMLESGKVLEINAFPGAQGLWKNYGVALGDLVVRRLEEALASDRRHRGVSSEEV